MSIVHFSGHGSSTGGILLADKNGNSKLVGTQALKALFTTLKDNIRIVVLNSCYSQAQAEVISETIDFVVGVHNTIDDDTAATFSASFYRAIGFNRSVKEAFDQGYTAILLEAIDRYGMDSLPSLFVREGADASECILDTNPNNDVILLKQYRKIFERSAFQVPCIWELFLSEVIEAIDDTQAALNTGSLYSRSGKLLATFPGKDAYVTEEFRTVFHEISQDLFHLKRLIIDFEQAFRRANPSYSHHDNFFAMVASLVDHADRDTVRDLIHQMDAVDKARNRILNRLNELYRKSGEQPFELIQLSSDVLKEEQVYGLKRIAEYVQYQ